MLTHTRQHGARTPPKRGAPRARVRLSHNVCASLSGEDCGAMASFALLLGTLLAGILLFGGSILSVALVSLKRRTRNRAERLEAQLQRGR
jgi:hypothetical protein